MFLLENVKISSLCHSSENKKPEIIQNKKNIWFLFSLREAIKIAKKSDFFLLSSIN
jgi:hypothetical protein